MTVKGKTMKSKDNLIRCAWVNLDSKLYVAYHDNQWGKPVFDDNLLFEMLILESFQAGLSWLTILKKRDNFRKAFDNFNPVKVARYDEWKQRELLQNKGIVRNGLKIKAAINNAKVFLEIQKEYGSFSNYIWKFVDGRPLQSKYQDISEVPCETKLSALISKDLKRRGMTFVGPTIIYSFMQAVGLVNDHEASCFRYAELRD